MRVEGGGGEGVVYFNDDIRYCPQNTFIRIFVLSDPGVPRTFAL